MATFGDDQFDREVKQLKTKLAQKGKHNRSHLPTDENCLRRLTCLW